MRSILVRSAATAELCATYWKMGSSLVSIRIRLHAHHSLVPPKIAVFCGLLLHTCRAEYGHTCTVQVVDV